MTDKKKVVTVRDVMKTNYGSIDGIATVKEALLKMKELGTAVLLVNKRTDADEHGLLLVSEIARQVLSVDRAADRVNVYEIMSKPVITVHPGMDIRYCARMFSDYEIVRVPVVEDGKVIGMVSPGHLVLDGMIQLI